MSVEDIKNHFVKRAQTYEHYSSWCKDPTLFKLCTEPLEDMLPSTKCLDLGGGSGWIAKADHKLSGREWTVLDLAPAKAEESGAGVNYVSGDMHRTPFADQYFGHIVMRSVLHYVDTPIVLREARRLLTHRGHLVVAQKVYDFSAENHMWHEQLARLRNPLARHSWTSSALAEAVSDAGFKILAQKSYVEQRRLLFSEWLSKAETISADHQLQIKQLIDRLPRSVREELGLELSGEMITYSRKWCVLILRQKKNDKMLSPAVLSLLVERKADGHLLLQKRKKRYEEPQYFGYWELPQGKIERGESLFQCAARELAEETGLSLLKLRSLSAINHGTDFISPLTVVRLSEGLDFVGIALLADAEGVAASSDLNREHTWMSVSDVQELRRKRLFYPLNLPMVSAWLESKGITD
jgi:8-oxo-dGTP pyrophosphatase MutT (NUDIX family)/ubiquinone/menaquinone biosynthesis C-methylase UbiE